MDMPAAKKTGRGRKVGDYCLMLDVDMQGASRPSIKIQMGRSGIRALLCIPVPVLDGRPPQLMVNPARTRPSGYGEYERTKAYASFRTEVSETDDSN